MTAYTITEPKGQITFKNNLWQGSTVSGQWAPFSPEENEGWKSGDTLTVTCTFNLNPGHTPGTPFENYVGPSSSDYIGLCVGALNKPTERQITDLKNSIIDSYVGGGKIFSGITANATPSATDIFYGATATTLGSNQVLKGKTRSGGTRGSLNSNVIYSWTMSYNASGGFDGKNVELVFGYGDPMDDEEKT